MKNKSKVQTQSSKTPKSFGKEICLNPELDPLLCAVLSRGPLTSVTNKNTKNKSHFSGFDEPKISITDNSYDLPPLFDLSPKYSYENDKLRLKPRHRIKSTGRSNYFYDNKETSKDNEYSGLNVLCNKLIEEQYKLKEQLKNQEVVIEKLRAGSKSQLSSHCKPLKLFQDAVSNLEKDRKFRFLNKRSVTPGMSSSKSREFRHPVEKPRSERSFSLNVQQASPKLDQNFTFRPGFSDSQSPNRNLRFPHEVFSSKRLKRRLQVSSLIQ